jgi:hypothetical protein
MIKFFKLEDTDTNDEDFCHGCLDNSVVSCAEYKFTDGYIRVLLCGDCFDRIKEEINNV